MVRIETPASAAREAGVVYTLPWMVELILDLAGYVPDQRLARRVALEPSAGDGAFLQAMVRRLVASCHCHGDPIEEATCAIQAFEIDPAAAGRARQCVEETLISLGVSSPAAAKLAQAWIRTDDFLEASLGFPIADYVLGNPPYIRLGEMGSVCKN